ncbi:MAG: MBL fold metallo-hydrolase [Candidatus Aenigmarchaeota archaeon]|nr:MBL fold metallo-hydrolase [Candidatus Aenigmarchaeota archaeon]
MVKNRLVFLGTAGGRHMVFSQERKSGGLLLELDGKRIAVDPGPGALVHMQRLKLHPEKTDAVMLSHIHIDHSSDVNILLDGIEKPVLVAEEHCVRKKSDYYEHPRVSKYHQDKSKVFAVSADQSVDLDGLKIETAKTNHTCPCVGFVISGTKKIGYASDGIYFKGQEKYFEGCDLLILNVHIPKGFETADKYMSVDDAILFLRAMKRKPQLTVVTHISSLMLRANLWRQIKIISESTGCNVIFAEDFMELDLGNLSAAPRILK